jgi:protein SCO1/2
LAFLYSMYNIIFIILLLIVSCSKSVKKEYDQSYPFTGIIIKKFEDKNQMLIDHDEVPGFMDKMVMIFNIDSTIDINHYNVGDSLNFNFYILNQKDAPAKTWANELKIVGHRQLTEEESYDDFFNEDYSINIGDQLSDATFLDINGNQIKLSQWNGKFKFISFIFSRCPMPNFCPAVIMKNQYLANQFKENDNIEFIIISFDYKYDTPEVLNNTYGTIFNEYNNVHFLSSYGYKQDIIKITTEAGLGFSGIDEGDEREIGHTLKSLLIDSNGILIQSYSGDSWSPKKVENNINERLKLYNAN